MHMDLKTYSTGIQHVGIPTNDIEATKDFYQKLGFEVIYETKDGDVPVAFLKLGTFVVETYQNNEAVMKVGSVDHLAIDVKDVEEVYAFINEIGLNNNNDTIHFLPFWENGFKYFKIDGPNKEVIEFGQIL
jgi:catechol 2,3-dioxygenase-like lactoylglutathione lyase family enzyme